MTAPRFALQGGGYNRQAAYAAILAGREGKGVSADLVPIGTVEWTQDYAAKVGVTLPPWETYPQALWPWLGRDVTPVPFRLAKAGNFVKPQRTKVFTGGIKANLEDPVEPDEMCWESEPVSFVAEWRCYVLRGQIVAISQYGEGDDADLNPTVPGEMVAAWPGQPAGWALDVGLLDDGRLVLVEANDGWALGLYNGCPRLAYLDVIAARWTELRGT